MVRPISVAVCVMFCSAEADCCSDAIDVSVLFMFSDCCSCVNCASCDRNCVPSTGCIGSWADICAVSSLKKSTPDASWDPVSPLYWPDGPDADCSCSMALDMFFLVWFQAVTSTRRDGSFLADGGRD